MPAWQNFMRQILPAYPEKTVTPPVGISSVRIDLATGLLSRSTDHTSSFEFFKLGTEPTQYVSGSVPQVQFGENNQQKQELEELF